MYSFIVLGHIPGTNLNISFEVWIIITIAAFLVLYRTWPRIQTFFDELEHPKIVRQPLHANQLHQRAV